MSGYHLLMLKYCKSKITADVSTIDLYFKTCNQYLCLQYSITANGTLSFLFYQFFFPFLCLSFFRFLRFFFPWNLIMYLLCNYFFPYSFYMTVLLWNLFVWIFCMNSFCTCLPGCLFPDSCHCTIAQNEVQWFKFVKAWKNAGGGVLRES